MSESVLKGSCFCGQISYRLVGDPLTTQNCHCRPCQKISGAPYIPFMDFNDQKVTWTVKNGDKISTLTGSDQALMEMAGPAISAIKSGVATRTFCSGCGSQMTMTYFHSPTTVGIPRGTLDQDSEEAEGVKIRSLYDIFADQKSKYCYNEAEALPQYKRFSPDFQDPF